ncbi:unnamed protein product [Acanthoscelides obtectus]|uniref:Uncharacterized protein n=1 Tax=Acanthoscelides obtectus TaxID=200917 RepID=A0A9P0Q7W0_ACAOB|nr:unnamed protein product [Acanthoscelides obtectus]CAK1624869.1 hypothetical protein AOBTE_LOCUS2809 [Acanthoscelides obtectus]
MQISSRRSLPTLWIEDLLKLGPV